MRDIFCGQQSDLAASFKAYNEVIPGVHKTQGITFIIIPTHI